MGKLRTSLAAAGVIVLVLLGLAWFAVVPEPLKQMVGFSLWRGSHVHASGRVAREPAGTSIFWEEYGKPDAPAVVVLHCGFGAILMMGAQIRALAEAHRVIAIDSRGHDKSTNTADALSYELMSDDVVAVMDAVKLPRADIVGWSDGGTIGLDMARRHAERVHKLVACGAVHDDTGTAKKDRDEVRNAAPDSDTFAPVKWIYEHNNPQPEHWPVFFAQMQKLILSEPHWTLAQLATIQVPVLLMNGEHDMVPLAHAQQMAHAMPHAQLEIITGASHEAPMSNPAEVNARMLAFLAAP